MAGRNAQQVAHDHSQSPSASQPDRRTAAGRERPREKAECVGEVGRCDGDYAEEREADEGVEAGPEVDELCERKDGRFGLARASLVPVRASWV